MERVFLEGGYTHNRVNPCVHVYVSIYTYIHIYIYIYISTCIHVYMCVYVCMSTQYVNTWVKAYICKIYTHIFVSLEILTGGGRTVRAGRAACRLRGRLDILKYVNTWVNVCMYMYIHTYIQSIYLSIYMYSQMAVVLCEQGVQRVFLECNYTYN